MRPQTLTSVRLFAGIDHDELNELARQCTWRRYHAGQQILGQFDKTTDVYFVLQGKVRAISYSLAGKEVAFRDIEAGGTFGEFAAIDGAPRSTSVVALVDASLIASLTSQAFWDTLDRHPQVTAMLLRRMTRLARSLTERVFEANTLPVASRIQAELLRLARNHMTDPNTAHISPAPTHAEIASRIGSRREAVTRELNELARVGLIEQRRSDLTVHDVSRLAALVYDVLGTDLPN